MCVKPLYMYVMCLANKDTAQGTQCKTYIPSIGETIYVTNNYTVQHRQFIRLGKEAHNAEQKPEVRLSDLTNVTNRLKLRTNITNKLQSTFTYISVLMLFFLTIGDYARLFTADV